MAKYIQPIPGLAVTKAKAASLPAPAVATDGVSINTTPNIWAPRGGAGYPDAAIEISADGNCTLTSASLWGLSVVTGIWCFIANLNNGSAITLTTTRNYVQQFTMPTVFTALALVGT